jgi:hypothetical protein
MRSTAVWASVMALLSVSACVAMQPSVVQPDRYLGRQVNAETIYRAAAAPVLLPIFDVRFEPMERLMLVNFGDDPVYEGIELQTFAASDGGESALALLWRREGVVDVYMTPNHAMSERSRQGIENLLNQITLQRAAFAYRLDVTEHGLDAALRMTDRDGRDVRFEIVETRGRPRLGALIAPVGAQTEDPAYLPIVFLDDFALVRRRGARLEVTIDGDRRAPDKMTRLVKGPASYFTRYSTRVVIVNWNERREAALRPLALEPGQAEIGDGNLGYRLSWNGPHPEVAAVTAHAGEDRVSFRFAPALPDLLSLREGTGVAGRFTISVNEVEGIVAGEYYVRRDPEGVRLVMQPLAAWQPPILKGAPWVASYRYEALVEVEAAGARLVGGWRRRTE